LVAAEQRNPPAEKQPETAIVIEVGSGVTAVDLPACRYAIVPSPPVHASRCEFVLEAGLPRLVLMADDGSFAGWKIVKIVVLSHVVGGTQRFKWTMRALHPVDVCPQICGCSVCEEPISSIKRHENFFERP
jgi:hypothetical protein